MIMKKINIFFKKATWSLCVATLAFGFTSCKEYLDKEPDTDVSETTVFSNFKNFEGFVEEMYNCIPNKESCCWCTSFNWGDDEIFNSGEGDAHFTHHIDLGDYRYWYANGNAQTFLAASSAASSATSPTSTNKFEHNLWGHAFYCIRKANIGLEHLDELQVATQEEKNVIAGQLYFFRAWWYEELMMFFGGFPYLDHALEATEPMNLPRLSFKECAEKCAADFAKAATYLPSNWNNTTVGKQTAGKNDLRVTKAVALAYQGKILLWAASPLYASGVELNGAHTYSYDKALAQRAADALGECLKNVDSGESPYALAEFNYKNVYNHERADDANTCFSDIFYTTGQNWKMPGTCEAMMRGPIPDVNGTNWNMAKIWGTKLNGLVEHDNIIHQPTANYINYAYGMANGLPLTDPESGFDPTHPFKDRDPRFYHDIIFDGFRYVDVDIPATDEAVKQQYCGLYTGGYTRDDNKGSRTGYYTQKLVPHECNKFDGLYNWAGSLQAYLPYMRLADVYLMYAEACAAVAGSNGKGSTYALTAEGAINILRDRVGAGHVNAKFLGDQNKFIDEVRRERACELAFEGFRWNDLQRWLLLTVAPYNTKTTQVFYRVAPDSWYESGANDPRDAQVAGWGEETILTRVFGTKHYWLPLPDKDVELYEEFEQNPGW